VEVEVMRQGDGPEPKCRRSPGVVHGLDNLVDNAIDFAAGKVIVEARWTRDQVRIEIRDDGPGFAPEILLRVGEPYVTTRGGERRERDGGGGGLGLGLFIAKTLIERSGAQIAFANAEPPATGAIVRIVWPRTAFERGTERSSDAALAPATLTAG
jgi:two-component system sensor histidine kinase RegB